MFNKFRHDKLVYFRFWWDTQICFFFTDKLSKFSKVRESVWTSGFQLATKQILRKQISMDTVGLQLVITFLKVEIRTKTSYKAAKFPRPEYQFPNQLFKKLTFQKLQFRKDIINHSGLLVLQETVISQALNPTFWTKIFQIWRSRTSRSDSGPETFSRAKFYRRKKKICRKWSRSTTGLYLSINHWINYPGCILLAKLHAKSFQQQQTWGLLSFG